MKLARRHFLHVAAGAAALPLLPRTASALDYPARPVRLVVGFFAGGLSDILARVLGPSLSEQFGQQFLVEDQPGAGTNIATEAVVKAAPDGYTSELDWGGVASAKLTVSGRQQCPRNANSDVPQIASVGSLIRRAAMCQEQSGGAVKSLMLRHGEPNDARCETDPSRDGLEFTGGDHQDAVAQHDSPVSERRL